jgi:hypothetical protein
MADQLKNILHFVAIPAGGTAVLPHGLHVASRALVPDFIDPNPKGLTITADATNVSVTNTTLNPLDVFVLVEAWHTIERAFGSKATQTLTPQPFVSGGDSGGGGGGGNPQEFRYTVTGVEPNPLDIVITLPVARADTLYNAHVTGGGLTNQVTFDTPVASYGLTTFHVAPSGALTAGDVLLISIRELT